MRKTLLFILPFLSISLANAGLLNPTINAVDGQIFTNDKNLDLTKLKITETIYCKSGWGDGIHICGTNSNEANVEKSGKFHLNKLVGKNSNWSTFRYEFSYDGNTIVTPNYDIRIDESEKDFNTMFKNLTLVKVAETELEFTTNSGQNFRQWQKQHNKNIPSDLIFNFKNNNFNNQNVKILPNLYATYTIEEDSVKLKESYYLAPGNLDEALKNSKINYTFFAQVGGYAAQILANKDVSLSDPKVEEKLNHLELDTAAVNFNFVGKWSTDIFSVDYPINGKQEMFTAPIILTNTKCENGILNGTLKFFLSKDEKKFETRSILGECSEQFAHFTLGQYPITQYEGSTVITLNLDITINQIYSREASSYVVKDIDHPNMQLSILADGYQCNEKIDRFCN